MVLFQSTGRVPLFIVMSSNRARYGILVSTPSFRISPDIPSGLIGFFFDRCYHFPTDFRINGEEFACVGPLYMLDVTLAAEYRRIVVIKRIILCCQIYDGPTIAVFEGRNIFPIFFRPFYVLVQLRLPFTFIV